MMSSRDNELIYLRLRGRILLHESLLDVSRLAGERVIANLRHVI